MTTLGEYPSGCLSIDLEVSPQDRSVLAFAGVRADSGQSVVWAKWATPAFSSGANLVVRDGDEVVRHLRVSAIDSALEDSTRWLMALSPFSVTI